MEGVHDDCAALHYELDLAEDGDVREGVALDGDEVGELAVFEGADLVLRVEKFGGGCGSGADGFERGEAALGERDELFGVFALALGASGVIAAGDFYAEGFGELDGILDLLKKAIPGLALFRREGCGAPRIVGVDASNRGNEEDALFLH